VWALKRAELDLCGSISVTMIDLELISIKAGFWSGFVRIFLPFIVIWFRKEHIKVMDNGRTVLALDFDVWCHRDES
jgi:thiamine transporter ThiT